ncbi:hypothetical protein QYZ88_008510 [Lachnospiraceae bacterium C1.1]|nr:hypothetical protein [Lachnospiraceae bacterium C1.1]
MDINVLCEKSSQAEAIALNEAVGKIISYECPKVDKSRWIQLMPYILRDDSNLRIDMEAYGVLIRNYEELEFVKQSGFNGKIIADAGLYSFNSYARKRLADDGVDKDTVPLELNFHEIKERGAEDSELIVYGRVPMMISANCLYLTSNRKCGKDIKKGHLMELTDRKKADFPVFADCRYCYNIVYNSVPLSLHKDIDKINSLDLSSVRLNFTTEEPEEVRKTTDYFIDLLNGREASAFEGAYTRGHFRKGVE